MPVGLKVLVFAAALGVLFSSSVYSQVLEGTILLPDSLGPLTGKNHIAFDEDPVHPRMFIGGEGGDAIVADAVTCERLARILAGPMRALCFVPAHNKLYVSTTDEYGVVVVDCSSYEVIKRLPFASLVTGLYYNPRIDRIYCASDPMKIVDCAGDSIVDSLMVNGRDANCALDIARSKLYVGAKDALKVIDCNSDSVVANVDGIRQARAICCQPAAGKAYVAVDESLFALNTEADSVVFRYGRSGALNARLASDPEHNRIYYSFGDGYWGGVFALDCERDGIIWQRSLWTWPSSLVDVPLQDKLYMMLSGTKYAFNGSTGEMSREFPNDSEDSLYYCLSANRVFVTRQELVVTAIDVQTDTLVGVVPLGAPVSSLTVDSVDNRLYFLSIYTPRVSRAGIVDCSTNKVESYSRVFRNAECLAHNSRDDKLYCSADSSIFVFDCRADTVVKRIPVGGFPSELVWYPSSNKLYALVSRDTCLLMIVVDCSRDTVVKTCGLNISVGWNIRLTTPEFDLLWVFSGPTYSVIDCLNDSIVQYTTDWGSSFTSAGYSPADRKVYAAKYEGLYVINVDTRLPIESIPNPMRDTYYAWSRQVYCAARAGKVYWTIQLDRGLPPVQIVDSVFVMDVRNDSIVSGLVVPTWSQEVCDDRSGDFVYFASDYLVAVDTRTDSIVSGVHLPQRASSLVKNGKTNRFYLAGYSNYYSDSVRVDSLILVVYDSVIYAGLEAKPGGPAQAERRQTLFCRNAPLRSPNDAVLFDVSGRRAAVLRSGTNDISSIAPGVYFVCEEPQAASLKPQAVRKVVLTE
jgi:DNA-binding beta-propeller fold protein YncE